MTRTSAMGLGRACILLLAALSLLACEPAAPAERSPTPASGAALAPPPASSVVALDPIAARFVVAIGAARQLVGVGASAADDPRWGDVPSATLKTALALSPTLVLVNEAPPPEDPDVTALTAAGARVAVFEPHDLEDVAELVRDIGTALVGHLAAMRFETALTQPLAKIGGASFGQPRPRTAALVAFDPLEIAGGHSFETDLIEIAGGHSVTHPGEAVRRVIAHEDWADLAPDLILVTTREVMPPAARASTRARLPEGVRVAFFEFAGPGFWLEDAVDPARRLRAIIAPIAAEMSAAAQGR